MIATIENISLEELLGLESTKSINAINKSMWKTSLGYSIQRILKDTEKSNDTEPEIDTYMKQEEYVYKKGALEMQLDYWIQILNNIKKKGPLPVILADLMETVLNLKDILADDDSELFDDEFNHFNTLKLRIKKIQNG
jgi:hypothetical protein